MGEIDDMLTADAPEFMAAFGETITVTEPGQAPRSISAIVDRSPAAVITAGGVYVPALRIHVRNHATLGLLASTVNQHGATRASAPLMQGGTPIEMGVYLPPSGLRGTQDAGMIVLDLH